MKHVIAVDVDEVLAQHNIALLHWHNSLYDTHHVIDDYSSDYWYSKIWNVSSDEADERLRIFHDSKIHRTLRPVDGAAEALSILKEKHDLVIVSARREVIADDSHWWIEQFYPGLFTGVHFLYGQHTGKSKAQVCKQIHASYLIDDSLKHCTQAAEAGIQVLLFGNYPWNQSTELHANIRRVNNWEEVNRILL